MEASSSDAYIEGISNDVLKAVAVVVVLGSPLLVCIWRKNMWLEGENIGWVVGTSWYTCLVAHHYLRLLSHQLAQAAIHPDSISNVDDVRRRMGIDPSTRSSRRHGDRDQTCPICLAPSAHPVETNCSHSFCAACFITYWHTGQWHGAVSCPVCRQRVTMLLPLDSGGGGADVQVMPDNIAGDLNAYNRRFSGQPRSIGEHLRDLPMLLRHIVADLFSVHGMVFVFRLRIMIVFVLAILYLLLPLDIVPEAVVGVVGLADDLIIVLLLAIYAAMVYRGMVAEQAAQ